MRIILKSWSKRRVPQTTMIISWPTFLRMSASGLFMTLSMKKLAKVNKWSACFILGKYFSHEYGDEKQKKKKIAWHDPIDCTDCKSCQSIPNGPSFDILKVAWGSWNQRPNAICRRQRCTTPQPPRYWHGDTSYQFCRVLLWNRLQQVFPIAAIALPLWWPTMGSFLWHCLLMSVQDVPISFQSAHCDPYVE